MMAKRMKLVPEEKYLKMIERSNASTDGVSKLETKGETASQLINDVNIPDDIKLAMYMSIVKDFSAKIDELRNRPIPVTVMSDLPSSSESNETPTTSKTLLKPVFEDEKIIKLIPENFRARASIVLEHFRDQSDLITWNKKGEVTFFKTEFVEGSSIIDLMNFLLRTLKWKVPPLGTNRFLLVCKKCNVPASVVRKDLRDEFTSPLESLTAVKSPSDSFENFDAYKSHAYNWTTLEDLDDDDDLFEDSQSFAIKE